MEIIEGIKHVSNTHTLTAFIVSAIVVILIRYKEFITKMLSDYKKTGNIEDLNVHGVFLATKDVLNRVQKIKFTTIDQEDKAKTLMMVKLIDLKTKQTDLVLKNLIQRKEVKSYSAQRLKYEINISTIKIRDLYRAEFENYYTVRGVLSEDCIFLLNSFEDFRKDVSEGFKTAVESIADNNSYSTNYDKLSAILEVYCMSLHLIPKDAKLSYNAVNGLFKKYNTVEAINKLKS